MRFPKVLRNLRMPRIFERHFNPIVVTTLNFFKDAKIFFRQFLHMNQESFDHYMSGLTMTDEEFKDQWGK
jgi:hypothetical protein